MEDKGRVRGKMEGEKAERKNGMKGREEKLKVK